MAPMCGAVDGVNEAGLCITYNYAYATDPCEPAPTISMLVSEALGHCRTVPEAIGFLSSARRWGGGLLMLGDASGQIGSVELSNTRSASHADLGGTDWLFHANRFRNSSMRSAEINDQAVYSNRSPRALRGERVHTSSDLREGRLQIRLSACRPLSSDDIHHVMSDHGAEDQASSHTICMHGNYWHTTACVQISPAERELRVSYSTACRAEFETFSL